MPAPIEFAFRLVVPSSREALRRDMVRAVLGDRTEGEGELTVLDEGPERFASRFRRGNVEQLRVLEWTPPDRARGAIEHSVGGAVRLSARHEVLLLPDPRGLALEVRYVLATPHRTLALSLQFARRRTLARRLARAWLPDADDDVWRSFALLPRVAT